MNWIILRTDFKKEASVCRQIEALGFDAWVPWGVRVVRSAESRRVTAKSRERSHKWFAILPGRVFATIPTDDGDLVARIL